MINPIGTMQRPDNIFTRQHKQNAPSTEVHAEAAKVPSFDVVKLSTPSEREAIREMKSYDKTYNNSTQVRNEFSGNNNRITKSANNNSKTQIKDDSYWASYKLPILDDRSNTILNKILDEKGLNQEEKGDFKISMMLSASIELEYNQRGEPVGFHEKTIFDTSKNSMLKMVEKFNLDIKNIIDHPPADVDIQWFELQFDIGNSLEKALA